MARLTAILHPALPVELTAHLDALKTDTALAVQQGDLTRAMANVHEISTVDPHSIAVLAPEKMLETIRPEVDHLLNRLTTVARIDAEGWLSQADQAVETSTHQALNWQTKPDTLLNVAHHLFDSGGYTNYVRSADLAQSILNYGPVPYSPFVDQFADALAPKPAAALTELENEKRVPSPPVLADVAKTAAALRKSGTPRILATWRRAPLLVLLLSWLGAGLIGGPIAVVLRSIWPDGWAVPLLDFAFQAWGIGFLALVGFGFYARIRTIRL